MIKNLKEKIIKMKKIYNFLFILVIFILNINNVISSNINWANSNNIYREEVNISINDSILSSYQILLNFNQSSLGTNFNWGNSCNDLRFYKNLTELNYWVENCDIINKNISVWIKTNSSLISNSIYKIYVYYGNSNILSNSNATNTFIPNKINLVTGLCPNGGCAYLTDVNVGRNIRANIGNPGWNIYGTGLVNSINYPSNPYSSNQDYFYMRFRSLFIPSITQSYTFATSSDDGSDVGLWNEDGYGYGLSTPTSLTSFETIIASWYGGHGTSTCGNSGIKTTKTLIANKGYWIDYVMQEGGGGQDAKFCINSGTGYKIFDNTNFNGKIFSRNYVKNEPKILNYGKEENHFIKTNPLESPFYSISPQPQTCIPIEDGNCSFSWLINATGLINTSWKMGILFSSNISSIKNNQTQFTIINIIKDLTQIFINYPLNNSKILGNGTISFNWKIISSTSPTNVSLFLNNVLNKTISCNSNLNCSLNLTLNRGYYKWNIVVNYFSGINKTSENFTFLNILKYSVNVMKNIIQINSSSYLNNVKIRNLENFTNPEIKYFDFTDISFLGNSFNPIYDWVKNINNQNFFGYLYFWKFNNTNFSPEKNISYISKGILNYKLSKNYIVGLE